MRAKMSGGSKKFLREFFGALVRTPQIFRRIAFRKRTLEEELQEALLRGSLRKAFSGFGLLMLGLGIVIGSGWAQLSGMAGQQYAGPAVIVSYLVSGLAALLAAACYGELCVEYPVSGGSFSYIMITFGELAAFVTLAGLVLEYVVGMAAVARGFSKYLALLCNLDPTIFTLEINNNTYFFDFMAGGIVMLMSVLLSLGVRESSFFVSSVTIVKLLLLVFVSIVGYTRGAVDNMSPFLDPNYGADGIFLGAASIFFAYTGFDAIGNAAEEAQNVAHLPWALIGTAGISCLIYVMLALSLVLLTYPSISAPGFPQFPCATGSWVQSPPTIGFTSAFVGAHCMKWMQYIVSLAALLGILTALTVGLFSVSRIVMVASRDWLLPPFLARISPRTQTPLVAQMVFGCIIALLAMMVKVEAATALVSFGTLIALWMVCNAQLFRRYVPDTQLRITRYGTVETGTKVETRSRMPGRHLSAHTRKVLVWVHLGAINLVCIALAAFYAETEPVGNTAGTVSANIYLGHGMGSVWFVVALFALAISLQLCCPLEYQPPGWHVPWFLMPWLPTVAIGLIVFSVGELPNSDYWKIAIYFGVVLAVYLLFSLPMSYIKHNQVDYVNTEELNVVELAFIDGSWQPARLRLFKPSLPPSAATTHTGSMEWREEGGLKAGSEGSSKEGTTRHAAGGAPAGSRTSGSFDGGSRVGSGGRVVRLTLPPTQEGVEQ